jgi:hypothetical protein
MPERHVLETIEGIPELLDRFRRLAATRRDGPAKHEGPELAALVVPDDAPTDLSLSASRLAT